RTILSRLGARAAVAVDGTAEPAYSFAAVAGGTDASGEALRAAQEQGAELFITGVCSPAERMIQRDAPTAVTEAGFERSLLPGLRALAARLAAQFAAAGLSAETD
ncbi:MAG TPA: hypothetical protein VKT77_16705, partial [Chthonomonadaceae bacterium]|nr:hypothetical protein [Chthonomonadaceae bacterium]